MNKIGFWGKRFYEFELGKNIGYSSVNFAINLVLLLAIFLKTYFPDLKNIHIYLPIIVLMLYFAIWLTGYILLKTNFYANIQQNSPNFKKLIDNIKNNK